MDREEILKRVKSAKDNGQEVVGVVGLGFVGTAVAANLARTEISGKPGFFIVGNDLDSPAGRDKCCKLNEGISPVYTDDKNLDAVINQAVLNDKNLVGSTDFEILKEVDVVVCCINLDVNRTPEKLDDITVPVELYKNLMIKIGKTVKLDTLVTVESTLPLGMCDKILLPSLCEGFEQQGVDISEKKPLLAFCYERVMPGPDYLDSVNNFWRAYAGVNKESSKRTREFLSKFVNTKDYPLWEHKHTRAAEMSKLLENSYRAMNIAFIEEWSTLAENVGVDLFDVINSIKMRKGTHDNMMRPGLGVGGYCLTKDALLAVYGSKELIKKDVEFPFSKKAILTNERMPLKAVNWVKEHFKGEVKNKKALLVGVTYIPAVSDTRNTPSEIVAKKLIDEGVNVTAFDPLMDNWEEMPDMKVSNDVENSFKNQDIIIICLPDKGHKEYLSESLINNMKKGSIVIDPWNMVGDQTIEKLIGQGVEVRIYGRGDTPHLN